MSRRFMRKVRRLRAVAKRAKDKINWDPMRHGRVKVEPQFGTLLGVEMNKAGLISVMRLEKIREQDLVKRLK